MEYSFTTILTSSWYVHHKANRTIFARKSQGKSQDFLRPQEMGLKPTPRPKIESTMIEIAVTNTIRPLSLSAVYDMLDFFQ